MIRRRIGPLENDAVEREQRQAEEWMAMLHIENRSCMTRLLAPGLPDVTQVSGMIG